MARSLAARIALAFVALSVALLAGVGGATFVVLRWDDRQQTFQSQVWVAGQPDVTPEPSA